MSRGYLKCPKCGSTRVEIAGGEIKFNFMGLISPAPMTKRVYVHKKHCLDCGYLW